MPTNSEWTSPDNERRELLQRALTVSSAGAILIQTFINRVVQQLTNREMGFQAMLDRKPGSGPAAYVNRRSPGATGGAWVADTDSSTEETGTPAQVSFAYKTLLTKGKVTRKMQAIGRSYGDTLATELAAKVEDFADALETNLITGDTGGDGSANQFNGLLTLVNAIPTQIIANSSAADNLYLTKLDEAIDAVKGSEMAGDLIILGSRAGMRRLNAELQAQQQFTNQVEIGAGFRVRSYDGIAMVKTTRMPDVLAADSTGYITKFTTGSTTALAVVNLRYVWLEELTSQSVLPLAKDTSQYDQFEIYWDGALVLANTFGASLLTNLSPTEV